MSADAVLTPDCPMCGAPMPDLFGLSVIFPICTNESCPVIQWDPQLTIAQNRANAVVLEDPFEVEDSNPEPLDSDTRVIKGTTGLEDQAGGETVGS